ncbi:MAG: NAD-dependent epimerase/dehydratase family protein [Rhodanobacter sp.]
MIIVTGSYGRVGRAICAELDAHGHEWQGVDIVALPEFTPSGRFAHRQCDLTSFGATVDMLQGADAVIHAAAVAYPRFKPEHVTFTENVAMNYNVFSAANLLALKKVVWLSSEKVYGYPFSRLRPAFVPINEDHPIQAENAYALSKCVSETVATQLAGQAVKSFVSLRSTLVQGRENYSGYRSFEKDPAVRLWALWSYIDVRDLARACRLAMEAELPGSHAFSIAATDTVMTIPSVELAARFFPSIEMKWPTDAGAYASFCDCRRAANMFGFTSKHHWRDEIGL